MTRNPRFITRSRDVYQNGVVTTLPPQAVPRDQRKALCRRARHRRGQPPLSREGQCSRIVCGKRRCATRLTFRPLTSLFLLCGSLTWRLRRHPPLLGEGLLTLLLLSIDGNEILKGSLKFYQTFRPLLEVRITVVPPRWGRVAGECPTGEVVLKRKLKLV